MGNDAPIPKEPTPLERDHAQAYQDMEDILILKKTPAFTRYFLRRLAEKREPLAFALLKRRLSPETYHETLTALLTLDMIAGLLESDEAGNRSIVS